MILVQNDFVKTGLGAAVGKRRWARFRVAPAVGAWCLVTAGASLADWPMYRGPEGNGVSRERIRTDWSAQPPQLLWRQPLTNGLSSVAISGGRVFTQVRRGNSEYCIALDATDGRWLWTRSVDQASYPNGGVGGDDGPRSTPAVGGDRLFVVGSYLKLHCLEVATGGIVWTRDLRSDFGGNVIPWQNAASPVLEGDVLLLNCNAAGRALLALRPQDGEVIWRRHDERMTHATPVPATIHDERQVVFLTQSGLVSLRPSDGQELWRYTPIPYNTSIAATPVVDEDTVFYAGAYAMGASAARIRPPGSANRVEPLWPRRSSRMIHWSSPVAVNGYVYGLFGYNNGRLRCLDLRSGDYAWDGPELGLGATILVDGLLLVAAENGDIHLVEPDPTQYREITRFTAINGRIWNSPGVSDGVLYVRGTTELAAFDVAPPLPPPLRLTALLDAPSHRVRFEVANVDGTPIAPARLSRIQLVESETTDAPLEAWTASSVTLTGDDGRLVGELELPEDASHRCFAARED